MVSKEEMAAERNMDFYSVIGAKSFGGVRLQLLKFNLPKVGRKTRNKMLNSLLDGRGADALVEVFWTKSSVLFRDKEKFYGYLMFETNADRFREGMDQSSDQHAVGHTDNHPA